MRLAPAAVGVVLGVAGATVILVGSGLILVPWAIVGLGIGWMSADARAARVNGLLYGFALSLSFLVAGYEGDASLLTVTVTFAVLSLFGAACGWLLSASARHMRSRRSRSAGER
ncbi:MAG: hypothetical protein WBV06_01075 [Acidimicrobiia bacterium]